MSINGVGTGSELSYLQQASTARAKGPSAEEAAESPQQEASENEGTVDVRG